MESLENGRGVPVVNPGEEHTFTLDEEALSRLLLQEDVRDRSAVVISVAGAFRKGKSFLLDFFLRYMHHKVVNTGPEHTFTLDEEALSRLLLQEDVRDRSAVVISVAGAFRKGKSFLLDFFLRYMHHKVVNTGPEHTFTLDEEALSRLLLQEDVRDRSAVVISVAGAFRKGKSFLLDFFLRYMHHKVVNTGPEHTFTLDEEALSRLLLQEDVRDRSAVVISVAGAFRKGKSFLLDFFLRYMHHKVVNTGPEHTFTLDEEALSRLLLQEDVRDRSAVVISVAGAFRKGKSFLLDFFLRYMHHKYNIKENSGEWLGSENEPLQGFSWRGGSERDTTGLLLWSQPFKATLDNGEKVVVFLMDTQGTFDSESTVRDNATVFALSTMLSSVQIYNISQNIEEDDLQHLQLFTEYGRLAQQSNEGGRKPFQRLQFLVRDWSFPYEHPYGAEGGQQLLAKRLEVHEGQHPELQSLRRHIAACFEELACFLMPHPGLNVATNPNFKGYLSDISQEFKTSLQQLVPMLLAPENLVPKLIEGQKIKAKDLLLYFKAYMKIFNGTELPEPKTILEATAEANNLSAVSEAREVYEKLMEEAVGGAKPYLQPRLMEEEHRRAKDKALHVFHSKRKMGGDALANVYGDSLVKELEETYEQLRAHNEGKNIFKIAGTPSVLVVVILLGYLVSVVGGALGVQTLVAVGQTVALGGVVMLLVWAYSRVTGNLRDVATQLDEFAETIRDYVLRQTWGSVSQRAAAAAVGYNADKKRS